MDWFVGDGITRDGLELVGERYGVLCVHLHFFIFDVLDLLLVYSCEYVIIFMCPCSFS